MRKNLNGPWKNVLKFDCSDDLKISIVRKYLDDVANYPGEDTIPSNVMGIGFCRLEMVSDEDMCKLLLELYALMRRNYSFDVRQPRLINMLDIIDPYVQDSPLYEKNVWGSRVAALAAAYGVAVIDAETLSYRGMKITMPKKDIEFILDSVYTSYTTHEFPLMENRSVRELLHEMEIIDNICDEEGLDWFASIYISAAYDDVDMVVAKFDGSNGDIITDIYEDFREMLIACDHDRSGIKHKPYFATDEFDFVIWAARDFVHNDNLYITFRTNDPETAIKALSSIRVPEVCLIGNVNEYSAVYPKNGREPGDWMLDGRVCEPGDVKLKYETSCNIDPKSDWYTKTFGELALDDLFLCMRCQSGFAACDCVCEYYNPPYWENEMIEMIVERKRNKMVAEEKKDGVEEPAHKDPIMPMVVAKFANNSVLRVYEEYRDIILNAEFGPIENPFGVEGGHAVDVEAFCHGSVLYITFKSKCPEDMIHGLFDNNRDLTLCLSGNSDEYLTYLYEPVMCCVECLDAEDIESYYDEMWFADTFRGLSVEDLFECGKCGHDYTEYGCMCGDN